jgi:hypothetical protein
MPDQQKNWKRITGKLNYSLVPIDPKTLEDSKTARQTAPDDEEGGQVSGAPTQQFILNF